MPIDAVRTLADLQMRDFNGEAPDKANTKELVATLNDLRERAQS